MLQYVDGKGPDDRRRFHVVSGLLTRTTDTGWLGSRQIQHRRYTLAVINEVILSLPWHLDRIPQAPLPPR